jgi:hypothetical protein
MEISNHCLSYSLVVTGLCASGIFALPFVFSVLIATLEILTIAIIHLDKLDQKF